MPVLFDGHDPSQFGVIEIKPDLFGERHLE